jgi:CMP-N,N'-diacetyllegionaminic acid synthase
MSVLALIPARSGSKGCVGKNWRQLGGKPLYRLALDCADAAGCDLIRVTSGWDTEFWNMPDPTGRYGIIRRPDALCSDSAAMVDVVKHALEQIPGKPDDIIVLLQPTQPFRTPERVKEAIALLESSGADSVVSVVPLPLTHHPEYVLSIYDASRQRLGVYIQDLGDRAPWDFSVLPARRQDVLPAYIRDGTVYAFKRSTVEQHGTIYGHDCRPLILDPSETCELDTEDQWREVEARWKAMHG